MFENTACLISIKSLGYPFIPQTYRFFSVTSAKTLRVTFKHITGVKKGLRYHGNMYLMSQNI